MIVSSSKLSLSEVMLMLLAVEADVIKEGFSILAIKAYPCR